MEGSPVTGLANRLNLDLQSSKHIRHLGRLQIEFLVLGIGQKALRKCWPKIRILGKILDEVLKQNILNLIPHICVTTRIPLRTVTFGDMELNLLTLVGPHVEAVRNVLHSVVLRAILNVGVSKIRGKRFLDSLDG